MIRGEYHPSLVQIRHVDGCELHVPMADQHGGQATAIYIPIAAHIWQLARVDEWLPPMSPQERARLYTDAAELPPLTKDGRTDFAAIRVRREREWMESA